KGEKDATVFAFDIETSSGKKTIAVANPVVPEINAIKEELSAFKDAILNNTKTIVSEMDGLMAMDVAHQILEKIGNKVISH
ncbi:MAG TPA: gfo/Idh/MocA family oxidoreductase, partial [Chitinophagaceae bacterium]